MTRKEFLKYNAYFGLGALVGSQALTSCTLEPKYDKWQGKRLIIIRLDGGNDGLFALAPVKHELLQEKRPRLLRYLKDGPEWQAGWRLHPALSGLADMVQRGEATLLPFTGYPNPNTSHFKSSEIWETGKLPGESHDKTGWIGRWSDESSANCRETLPAVLNFDGANRLFGSGHNCEAGEWGDEQALQYFEDELASWKVQHADHPLSKRVAQQERILRLQQSLRTPSGFPDTSFGQQLAQIAGVLLQDMPFRVLHATQSGYDTHLGQPGRLQKLYTELNQGLSVLMKTLRTNNLIQQTAVLLYSEFGRSMDENENEGTDHGAAGLSVIVGSSSLTGNSAFTHSTEMVFEDSISNQGIPPSFDFREIQKDVLRWLS